MYNEELNELEPVTTTASLESNASRIKKVIAECETYKETIEVAKNALDDAEHELRSLMAERPEE